MDLDLLSGLDELSTPQQKGSEQPKGTFVFGRSKTPELRTSRSLSRINSKSDEVEWSMAHDSSLLGQKKSLQKVAQSTVFDGVLKEASKKIAKDSQEVNYLSKNKETIVQVSKRNASKSTERPISKSKQYESVQTKVVDKKVKKVDSKLEAEKENNPPQKKTKFEPILEKKASIPQLKNQIIEPELLQKVIDTNVVSKKQAMTKKQLPSTSPAPNIKKDKEVESYSSRADQKNNSALPSKAPKSPLVKNNVEEKVDKIPEKSPAKGTRDTSKNGSKKQYKPETLDLYMRLNEYTKFKENVEKLSQPEPQTIAAPTKQAVAQPAQTKEKTEEFLKKQISHFKQQQSPKKDHRQRTPQKSIDLQKVSVPRYKKQAVEIPNECSFQPMLSKKSMQIVQKMVV